MKAKIGWSDVETGKLNEITVKQEPRYVPVCTIMVVTDNEKRVLHKYSLYLKGITGKLFIEER